MPIPLIVPAIMAGARIVGGMALRAGAGAVARGVAGTVAKTAVGNTARGVAGQAAKTAATGVAKTGTGAVSKAVNAASTASMLPTGGGNIDDSWLEAAKKASGSWQGWSR